MIIGGRCTNPKCDNAKAGTIFPPTQLHKMKLGPMNGPWECPDCHQEMYTERRATDKPEDSQKKPPTKSQKRKVAHPGSSTLKHRGKKSTPKKTTSKRTIVKKP